MLSRLLFSSGRCFPLAAASPEGFCVELGGAWNPAKPVCEMRFTVRGTSLDPNTGQHRVNIDAQYPADLIDQPIVGPAMRGYLRDFSASFGRAPNWLLNDADASITYQMHEHSNQVRSVVLTNLWDVHGTAHPSNELRTFTFDLATGRQLGLADLLQPGLDPLVALPPLVRPFLRAELDRLEALHHYKIETSRFEPKTADNPYTSFDGYRAFALDKDELILMMPAARSGPLEAGLVSPHIPLAALRSVLRPAYLPA